jgi:hypothetical protein
MLEDMYVPICLLAFLSAIIFIVIIRQLTTSKSHTLNILSMASGITALAGAPIILALNSKTQIEEARSEFETNRRPWVYADVGPPAGPLSFDQNGPLLQLHI